MYQITAFVKGLPANSFISTNKRGSKLTWEWREDGPSDLRHKETRPGWDDKEIPENAIVFGETGAATMSLDVDRVGHFASNGNGSDPHPSQRYMWHVRKMQEELQAAEKHKESQYGFRGGGLGMPPPSPPPRAPPMPPAPLPRPGEGSGRAPPARAGRGVTPPRRPAPRSSSPRNGGISRGPARPGSPARA